MPRRFSQLPERSTESLTPTQKPVNLLMIWVLNLIPCCGLIYAQGWKALKYVYWIWLLEFAVWRFEFAVFIWLATSIAAMIIVSNKDLKTTLDERYAELYPDHIVYNKDDGTQRTRTFQRSSQEYVEEESATNDTANSAASFLAAPAATGQQGESVSPLTISEQVQMEPLGTYTQPAAEASSYATGQYVFSSESSLPSQQDSVIAVPTVPEIAMVSSTPVSGYSITPANNEISLMNIDSFLSQGTTDLYVGVTQPSAQQTPDAKCSKCEADRDQNFSFCISCGHNFT